MNRLREVREEKKLDNKGFSLVELIIVIAIMAVLIGVLAPQYLKYVERSRQSADIDNVDAIIGAVVTYSADPAYAMAQGTITCTDGVVTVDGTVGTVGGLADAMDKMGINIPASPNKLMKSNSYKEWTITIASDGTMTFGGNNGAALQAALGR